jgi:hypothetical protein
MLMGLKRRNDFSEKDLAAAVGKALRRSAAKRYCEDCGVKVAGGAAINCGGPPGGGGRGGGSRGLQGPLGLAIPILAWPPIYIESPARYDVNETLRNDHLNHRRSQAAGCRERGRLAGALAARRGTRER